MNYTRVWICVGILVIFTLCGGVYYTTPSRPLLLQFVERIPLNMVPPEIIGRADDNSNDSAQGQTRQGQTRHKNVSSQALEIDSPGAGYDVVISRSTSAERASMTKVLLMTYYRGGSSFFGQLFAQNKEAFYWFEPLYTNKPTMRTITLTINGSRLVGPDFQMLPNGTLG